MDKNEKQAVTLYLLAKNEEAIAGLYQAYSQKFKEMAIWSELVNDELEHAKWLRDLGSQIGEGKVFFKEDRFDPNAIQTSINDINKLASEADDPNVLPINALSYAKDLENSLLESNYFEVFDGDDPSLKEVLNKLKIETEGHAQKVSGALAQMKEK